MSHHYDYDLDDSPDLRAWLTDRFRQWQRQLLHGYGDAHGSGYDDFPQTTGASVGKRALNVTVLIVLAVLGIVLAGLYSIYPERSRHDLDTLYAQRSVSIHSTRSYASAVVRTLALGDSVLATRPDGGHWMEVSEPGAGPIGYAYGSSEFLAPNPPPDAQPAGEPPPPAVRDSAPKRVTREPAPADTTAICKDGWISQSKHASGTCSSHGGVAQWVHHP